MPEQEIWVNIPEFDNYSVSNQGRVYNHRSEALMAYSKTSYGDLKVTLVNESTRRTRSVRVLVAEAFVPNTFAQGQSYNSMDVHDDMTFAPFDKVILKDNHRDHVWASNLAWRPMWFAQAYAKQFRTLFFQNNQHAYTTHPVVNVQTGERHNNIIECGVDKGILFIDILLSINNGDTVFPFWNSYDWDT